MTTPVTQNKTDIATNAAAIAAINTGWSLISTTIDDTPEAGEYFLADIETTGNITLTLDGSYAAGDRVGFKVASKSTAGRKLTIDANGKTIDGSSDDLILTILNWSMVLLYDGTNWHIEYDGRFEKIDEKVITSSTASTFFADDWSVFRSLRLEVSDFRPVNNGASLIWRISTDFGSTFIATSTYAFAQHYGYSAGHAVSASTVSYGIVIASVWNSLPHGGSASLVLSNPSAAKTTNGMSFCSNVLSGGQQVTQQISSVQVGSNVANGLRLGCTTGSMAEGIFSLYGIK